MDRETELVSGKGGCEKALCHIAFNDITATVASAAHWECGERGPIIVSIHDFMTNTHTARARGGLWLGRFFLSSSERTMWRVHSLSGLKHSE